MKVKIVNKSGHKNPNYGTELSAGADVRAVIGPTPSAYKLMEGSLYREDEKTIILGRNSRILLKTGIFVEIPEGFEMQIRPRSGLALKSGITVLNSPATIDADYRGEIGVILVNTSCNGFKIQDGDRICQFVLNKFDKIEWENVESLGETDRGSGGYGHTGKQ